MPEVIPIITAIVAAVGVGTQIYGITNQPGTPNVSKLAAATPQSPQTNAAQSASVSQELPTLQALTGGSLSPEYFAQYGGAQSGLSNNPSAAGNIRAAIDQFFGLTASGTTGLTPASSTTGGGTTSITDLLSRAGGGQRTAGGGSGVVDGLFNSDEFRGLAA